MSHLSMTAPLRIWLPEFSRDSQFHYAWERFLIFERFHFTENILFFQPEITVGNRMFSTHIRTRPGDPDTYQEIFLDN